MFWPHVKPLNQKVLAQAKICFGHLEHVKIFGPRVKKSFEHFEIRLKSFLVFWHRVIIFYIYLDFRLKDFLTPWPRVGHFGIVLESCSV